VTFPSEDEEKMAGETELADLELAYENRPAGPPGVPGAEPSHEDTAADPARVTNVSPPAGSGSPANTVDGGAPVDAVTDSRWREVQAAFVDDPRASVAEAAGLVNEAVEALITTVREQQESLASSWQAQDADTEELRSAFREYRTFWNSVTGLAQSA
jgi:hypothetical protein